MDKAANPRRAESKEGNGMDDKFIVPDQDPSQEHQFGAPPSREEVVSSPVVFVPFPAYTTKGGVS